jgi:hypothetical protein
VIWEQIINLNKFEMAYVGAGLSVSEAEEKRKLY